MFINKTLKEYSENNMYPFHMPGHKRQLDGEYKIDFTEVEGVDDLHDPAGCIEEEQKRIAKIYRADKSYILVGGSTVGNLVAVYAALDENEKILIQRSSHKSIYNAVALRHCKVAYIDNEVNEYDINLPASTQSIKKAIKDNPDTKALMLTSPTYEGYHINIREVAEICSENGIILIVDQAHGAHLGFNEAFLNSAADLADITIQSLHKTLPALTQTAVLHTKGNKIDTDAIKNALDIFETSSPSYVLMKSVSDCMDIVENKENIFADYVDKLEKFYKSSGQLKKLCVIQENNELKDPGKIIISTKNTDLSGIGLAAILRDEFEIETEMASYNYVIAMTSIMDTFEGYERLTKALIEIDTRLKDSRNSMPQIKVSYEKVMEPWEALKEKGKKRKLSDSQNEISAQMVCVYPPGSPILVPGERITREILGAIEQARKSKLHVTGVREESILIVK